MNTRIVVFAAVLLLAAKPHGASKKKKGDAKPEASPAASATASPAPSASASPAVTATPAAAETAAAPKETPVPGAPSPHAEIKFGDQVLVTKVNGAYEQGAVRENTGAGLLLDSRGTRATIAWKDVTTVKRTGSGGETLFKKGEGVRVHKVSGDSVLGTVDSAVADGLHLTPADASAPTTIAWGDIRMTESVDAPPRKRTKSGWLNRIIGICF